MERNAQKNLKEWFTKKNRKPLILRGARQVGKSTLVHLFCEQENIDLFSLNLEKEKLKSIQHDDFSMEALLDEIQFKCKKKLHSNAILFFDEIQEQPKLLKLIRYFYEEKPDIAVITAGSLLEAIVHEESFSFPVGRVEFLHLGPMTFLEFLKATSNQLLLEKIQKQNLSEVVHLQALKEFRNYLYVGGMPEAVKTFAQEKSFLNVRAIQEQILQSYLADFPKYHSRVNYQRIQRIFAISAQQIGKKVIYQRFDSESQSRDIRRVLELLIDARVLLPCVHSKANSIPLAGESDPSTQKFYFLDVGLLNCMLKLDVNALDDELKNQFNTKGIIAEQFVAQHLAYAENPHLHPQLHYWLRDKGSQKGEIDFLIQNKQEIIPIEVKAKKEGHLKSLFYFAKEKKKKFAIKTSVEYFTRKTVKHKIENEIVQLQLTTLPIYAIELIYDYL